MLRLTAPAIHRFREKASVFLTELHPAADAPAREAVLARLRRRDFDASHHCSAWRTAGTINPHSSATAMPRLMFRW